MSTPSHWLPIGPSRHREMPLDQRIRLYRDTIGMLRVEERPTRTRWQEQELKTAKGAAMLITGITHVKTHQHIALLSEMLQEALGLQAAIHEGKVSMPTP